MNNLKYLYLLLIMLLVVYLNGGNFFQMRKAAFSAFNSHIKEYEIDPKLFVGPILDLTDKNDLTFKWCHDDKSDKDTLCLLVSVPPYFSSFRAEVGGIGGTPEAWKKLAGTKKSGE